MMRNQMNLNTQRQKLGWRPNDEKPKEQTNKVRQNLGWRPNDEK